MLTLIGLGLLQAVSPLAVVDDVIRADHDVLHYEIRVAIPDTGTSIAGSTLIQYVVNGVGPLQLDFDSVMTVDSVAAVAGRVRHPVVWEWNADGRGLWVAHWGHLGDTLTVAVHYHGHPGDGLVIQQNVHGVRSAFADNWPDRARHWFPSENHPSDKATVGFAIEVPGTWRAIANGSFVSEEARDRGRSVLHWRTEHPIPVHTMVIGAADMAVADIGVAAGVPQSVWTFPQDSAFAVAVPFRRANRMVEEFTNLIGPFPYEKLAHVQSSTRFGGMENSSAIFYNERGYASRRMGEGVVAHEIAHQWFGDAVSQYDWHHLWLSEGFASYFGPLFYELVGEDSTFRARMQSNKESYLSSSVVDRPVIDTSERTLLRLLNANNYQKGAWVLHMLRGEIGDTAFFGGIREYYATYRDSTALSSDLATVMSRHAGRSLEWFFRQWLSQPGYPILDVSWESADDGTGLAVRVSQTQPASWGAFRFKLPIRVALSDGSVRDIVAEVRGGDFELKVTDLSASPHRVRVDPSATMLLEVRTLERRQ